MFRKFSFLGPLFTVLDKEAGCVEKKADQSVLLSGRDFDVHWTQGSRAKIFQQVWLQNSKQQ